ncbi:MAG: hypothetical protein ISS77_03310 [Phycisphaerae bacterium]|nr:hypothetical protein [Phycisphaerae bacterium]
MSTLTKILVVLLTFSVIALCPIVAVYVATADNYKQLDETHKRAAASEKSEKNEAKSQLSDYMTKSDTEKKSLNAQISSLKQQMASTEIELKNALRAKADLEERVKSWTAVVADFTETNDKQGTLLKNTLAELDNSKTEQIRLKKELDETTAYLRERLAIISDIERKSKELIEQKTELQKRLDNLLQGVGQKVVAPEPVIAAKSPVAKAFVPQPQVEEIGLVGLVSEVKAKDSMVAINIGSVDGVHEGMKFHIIRGDEFIRDILIIDVEEDEALGVFDIGAGVPKVGDNASTNF